jgi:hypothetical protein
VSPSPARRRKVERKRHQDIAHRRAVASRYAARATDAVCLLQDHDGPRSRLGRDLRSVPAVKNPVQPPVYRATTKVEVIPGADKPLDENALGNPIQRGFISGIDSMIAW